MTREEAEFMLHDRHLTIEGGRTVEAYTHLVVDVIIEAYNRGRFGIAKHNSNNTNDRHQCEQSEGSKINVIP